MSGTARPGQPAPRLPAIRARAGPARVTLAPLHSIPRPQVCASLGRGEPLGGRGGMATRPNPRRANGHRRTQLRRRVLAAYDRCAICGGAVDKTLGMLPGQHGPRCQGGDCQGCIPHPMRPEVDEIIPVSKGGSPYLWANVRLTHRICNQRRGNAMVGDQRDTRARRLGAATPAQRGSRDWLTDD